MSLATDIQTDNFVWDAIAANLPGSRKKGVGKFDINIDCPMCVLRGEKRPDKFQRCGLKRNPSGIGINCFNCGFKTRWNIGEYISSPLSSFLMELGVPDTDVKRMAHRALVISRTLGSDLGGLIPIVDTYNPDFKPLALPKGAKTLGEWLNAGCEDERFIKAVEYLSSRGHDIAMGYTYYWTPDAGEMMANRLIVPMYFKDAIVGWTARDTTGTQERKYHADSPEDVLFNSRALEIPHRKYAFILEGPFDAIGVDGVGTLGAKLSDNQARWINTSGKIPVQVVDRDRSGIRNLDAALKNKWFVAFPRLASAGWWDADVKDVGKAVELYGKLYVTQSILSTMTQDPYKIEVWSKLLV
jgi:hypothetical protein